MRITLSFVLAVSVLASVGCGGYSDVAPVSGVVTLDGEPLPDAQIVFTPVKEGRPSEASSDAQGNFTLRYTRNVYGAEIGEHLVRITTSRNKKGPNGDVLTPELVPDRYNLNSKLTKKIAGGSNTINLELKSD